MNENVGTQKGEFSIELAIQSIKSARDQCLSRLQKDSELYQFLEEHYAVSGLSTIRTEFLKRDLKELRDSPLDLVHYSSLIKQLKESNSMVVNENHALILSELRKIVEKIRG